MLFIDVTGLAKNNDADVEGDVYDRPFRFTLPIRCVTLECGDPNSPTPSYWARIYWPRQSCNCTYYKLEKREYDRLRKILTKYVEKNNFPEEQMRDAIEDLEVE